MTALAVSLLPHGVRGFLDWFCLKGRGYQFWSGIAIPTALFSSAFAFWRKHNCHVRWCPLLSWKTATDDRGDEHSLCRLHHPARPISAADCRKLRRR